MKSLWRKIYQQKLTQLSEFRRSEATHRASLALREISQRENPPTGLILSFWPLPKELDLKPINREWAQQGLLALPRVYQKKLTLHQVANLDELQPHPRFSSLWEPDPERHPVVSKEDLKLILVPGLAFDQAGYRLGRGGGYYDRFLAGVDRSKVRIIGVGFQEQLSESKLVPRESHDQLIPELRFF